MQLYLLCIALGLVRSISSDLATLNQQNQLIPKQNRNILSSFSCTDTNNTQSPECSYHGRCINGNSCICNAGYGTLSLSSAVCGYEQKKQKTAFLYQLFLSPHFGMGYFYLGYYAEGTIIVFLFWLGVVISSISGCCECYGALGPGLFLIFMSLFWSLYMLIPFGLNVFPDHNNVPLIPW